MSINQPLVSILITSYNYDRYLREAIDSVLNQTYPNTEVILVDDGSTDKSREIIESYRNKIIPVYKENGGQSSAFNAGFAVSQGKIICFLDSDDVLLLQKVEKVVEAFNTYPGAVVVYHRMQNVDHAGKELGGPWPPYKAIRGDISSRVARTGGWWPWPPTSALSFRREFLNKVMNMPEGNDLVFADAYLADLAPFFGEVVGLEQVLCHFRFHDSNLWSNPVGVEENIKTMRFLQNHERQEKVLNSALKGLGIPVEISLADHQPYQLTKYQLGQGKSVLSLSLLVLRNPWEHKLASKLKTVAQLWLQRLRWSRL